MEAAKGRDGGRETDRLRRKYAAGVGGRRHAAGETGIVGHATRGRAKARSMTPVAWFMPIRRGASSPAMSERGEGLSAPPPVFRRAKKGRKRKKLP